MVSSSNEKLPEQNVPVLRFRRLGRRPEDVGTEVHRPGGRHRLGIDRVHHRVRVRIFKLVAFPVFTGILNLETSMVIKGVHCSARCRNKGPSAAKCLYWSRIVAFCTLRYRNKVFLKQINLSFIQDKCCHLTMCLRLIDASYLAKLKRFERCYKRP